MAYDGFLIAGPTASGKSRLALNLARQYQAVIINADSMQVYKGLPRITASPLPEEFLKAKHFLYNYIEPFSNYSVGHWLRDIKHILDHLEQKKFIIIGGTGLYFYALSGALSNIPPISEEIRQKWRHRLKQEGGEGLFKLLQKQDPLSAKKIFNQDYQRIVRALEVFDMTQKPLSFWQDSPRENLLQNYSVKKILLMPERSKLYQKIEKRFDIMIEQGAISEVETFLEIYKKHNIKEKDWPVTKAIGFLEISAYLEGKTDLSYAMERAKIRSRQYAKRQMTWFKNRFDENWQMIE